MSELFHWLGYHNVHFCWSSKILVTSYMWYILWIVILDSFHNKNMYYTRVIAIWIKTGKLYIQKSVISFKNVYISVFFTYRFTSVMMLLNVSRPRTMKSTRHSRWGWGWKLTCEQTGDEIATVNDKFTLLGRRSCTEENEKSGEGERSKTSKRPKVKYGFKSLNDSR